MGLSDGAFFMIKHTPLPNGNHPILSPICPMGVADTLEHYSCCLLCTLLSGPNNSLILNKCVALIFSSPFIGGNECFWESFKSYRGEKTHVGWIIFCE